jgi:hypothetical protein
VVDVTCTATFYKDLLFFTDRRNSHSNERTKKGRIETDDDATE